MSQLNKSQVRALVRQFIDDPAGKLWNNTNLDLLIEGCLDELYGDLLDEFPYLRWSQITTTPQAPGYLELWDSSTASNFVRMYRIQKVLQNGVPYKYVRPSEVMLSGETVVNGLFTGANLQVVSAPDQSYTVFGASNSSTLHCFPYSMAPITVSYNSLPEPFTSLTPGPDPDSEDDDDVSFVEWPDGYHLAYVYDIAAKAIEKGDRGESAKLQRRSEMAMHRLKAFLRKQTSGPVMPEVYDSDWQWGGV